MVPALEGVIPILEDADSFDLAITKLVVRKQIIEIKPLFRFRSLRDSQARIVCVSESWYKWVAKAIGGLVPLSVVT